MYIKPYLSYVGGKFTLLDDILPIIHSDNSSTFVDVFGGSLCLSLQIYNKQVIANEYCKPILDLHRWVRNTDYELVKEIMISYEAYMKKDPKWTYGKVRDIYNSSTGKPHLLYILSRLAFGGMIRFNSKLGFNTSYGRYSSINYDNLRLAHKKLQSTVLVSKDFSQILKPRKDTIFYCDPPYLISDAPYNRWWGLDKEKLLYRRLTELDEAGTKWVLSNVVTHKGEVNPYLKKFIKGFNVIELEKKYHGTINGLKSKSGNTQEIICHNL